ncbi:MAG: S49 family peptidase [Planctomycetota bacterium]
MISMQDSSKGLIVRARVRGEIVTEPGRDLIESWRSYCGIDDLAGFAKAMRSDDDVAGVIFEIDSDGGDVFRLRHAVDAVASLSRVKPTLAYIDERALSAAYWIASQCGQIWAATAYANVGSIGVRYELYDESERRAKQGVAREVIAEGDGKALATGAGPITDADREAVRRRLRPMRAAFVRDVAAGRGMAESDVLAIGAHVLPAGEALDAGLIDDIVPADGLDVTFAERALGLQTERVA